MKKILVLTPFPKNVAASQRLKFEQFYNSWKNSGYVIHTHSFYSLKVWKIFFEKNFIIAKIISTIFGILNRIKILFEVRKYDIIFLHMWGTPIGLPIYEFFLILFSKKVIYDFDDCIYLKTRHFFSKSYKANFLIK